MIRVENLIKSYNGEPLLRGTCFNVKQGEFASIMGESGSGKTTILEILAGVRVPDGGKAIIDGVDVLSLNEEELALFRRNKIGVVYQNFGLIPTLTAKENIILPLLLKKTNIAECEKDMLSMAERLHIAECLDKYPGELSGGQQQRVAIVRAVIHSPKILLLDEPTGSLDFENTKRTLEFLADLRTSRNITILQITHDIYAAEYGTRILRIRDGVIIE